MFSLLAQLFILISIGGKAGKYTQVHTAMVSVTTLKSSEEKQEIVNYLVNNVLPTFQYRQLATKFVEKCNKFEYLNGILYLKRKDDRLEAIAPQETERIR